MTPQTSRRPVAATDRVSDVLARDERLVDVFVGQAPHFSTLRNPAMRRVMARLVTIEQAARVAAVPAESLVRALNDALGIASDPAPSVAEAATAPPAADPGLPPRGWREVEVDVRDDLRKGREPFAKIMKAVGELAEREVLHLRAPFEPAPLFAVLAKRGFVSHAVTHAPDDWSVRFWRSGATEAHPAVESAPLDAAPRADGATWLDVRGLEPPEPMLRTLAALETLPEGTELVQVNARVPQFLLPMLAERGFAFEIDESGPDRVLVRIRRAR